jgi:hypothetical protein
MQNTLSKNEVFDLNVWYPHIKKIVSSKCKIPHDDREDAMQEICLALLKKQGGKSKFDCSKSSPTSYIMMVANNTLANRYRKNIKKRDGVEVSIQELQDKSNFDIPIVTNDNEFDMLNKLNKFETYLFEHDPGFLPYFNMMKQGYSLSKISLKEKISAYLIKEKFDVIVRKFQSVIIKEKDKNFQIEFGIQRRTLQVL